MLTYPCIEKMSRITTGYLGTHEYPEMSCGTRDELGRCRVREQKSSDLKLQPHYEIGVADAKTHKLVDWSCCANFTSLLLE